MSYRGRQTNRRGFVFITLCLSATALFAAVGVVTDFGRLFVHKTQVQSYADALAIRAALELDGTTQGLIDATGVVANGNTFAALGEFAPVVQGVEFAATSSGPWQEANSAPVNSQFVRVRTQAGIALYFLGIIGHRSGTVAGRAIAGQVPMTGFGDGLFPFSPFAHTKTPPDFGLTQGEMYTLRWPSNPKLPPIPGGPSNVCLGDQVQPVIDMANASGGAERGFIEESSASMVRETVVGNRQTIYREIGDIIDFTGGAKQTILDALLVRIGQDTDQSSTTYAQYLTNRVGNGRRLVGVPINDGGTPLGTDNRMIGIGAFFLVPTGEYGSGGNQSWCAEYVGAWVKGSRKKGAGASGAYEVRLVG